MIIDPPVNHHVVKHGQILKSVSSYCFIVLFIIASGLPVSAQKKCAAETPTQQQLDFFNNTASSVSNQRTLSAVKFIAIKPHVVRMTNSTGGATISDLNQTLAKLNTTFKDLNVVFYFSSSGIKYIDNNEFYDFDSRQENELTQGNDVNNAINIYFLNSIKINGFEGSGGYAYFPGKEAYTNRIFILNAATKGDHTLAHELGHYFGLVHTFERIGGMELVSRGEDGNCDYAGDQICDTAADPYGMDDATWEGCEYTGTVTDLNGDLYSPPSDNIMSYYNLCAQKFTPGQFERMDIGTSIRVSQTEYNLLSDVAANVASPEKLTYNYNANNISLKWQDKSDNETGFLVERSTSPDGRYEAIAGVGPNLTSYIDKEILPGVSYYYRVKPSNTAHNYSNVVVHCPAVPNLPVIVGETDACTDGYDYSITFSEGLTYTWSISGGGNIVYEKNNAKVEWNTPGLYSVTVTASNGCNSENTVSLWVQVSDGDFAKASTIQGLEEVCMGASTYSVEAIEGVDYLWEISSGGSLTTEGNTATVNWNLPGNHTVSLTPSNNCGKGEAITLKVKVLENPSLEDLDVIKTRNTTVCIGSYDYSVNHINDIQYKWSIPEGSGRISSDGANATIDWKTPGTYDLTLTAGNRCGEDLVQTIQIKVVETPLKPTISIVNGQLSSNLSGEHQWFLNDEPIGGAIGPVCPSTLAGKYTVQQISACGQGPVSDAYVLDKPLVYNDQDHKIFIYPNPASENVAVELPDDLEWDHVSLVSAMGETLVLLQEKENNETTIRGSQYKRLIKFEVGNLSPGLYMIKVRLKEGNISKRLLVK